MANRAAAASERREGDRNQLAGLTRSSTVRAGLAQRSGNVLLAAQGASNTTIADKVGVTRPTVIQWRNRYAASGIDGLADEPRAGRPGQIDHAKIVSVTLATPPKKGGVRHWSSGPLARHLRISNGTVAPA